MANLDLIVLQSNKQKRLPSNAQTIDFTGVRIGADTLPLVQGGSGGSAYFDFGARALRTSLAPSNANDLVNKSYADAISAGLQLRLSVRLATAAALAAYTAAGSGVGKTLTADANGALSVDSVAVVNGNRVLIKNETAGAAVHNGIYTVTDAGSAGTPFILTRATDADASAEVTAGMYTFVEEGTVNDNTGWVLTTNNPITLDTTLLAFTQFSASTSLTGGNGITVGSGTISVNHDGDGLTFNGVQLSIELDSTTLSKSASGLKVATGGITGTELNASVAGAGLAGGGGSALSVNTGVGTKILSDAVVADYATALTNDNAGTISISEIVYIKSNGNVDLAQATTAGLADVELGIVEAATIATTASGSIIVRRGAIASGFTGLTPGVRVYVSRSTAGAVTQSLSGFVAGEFVYSVGHALTATQVIFDPQFVLEY